MWVCMSMYIYAHLPFCGHFVFCVHMCMYIACMFSYIHEYVHIYGFCVLVRMNVHIYQHVPMVICTWVYMNVFMSMNFKNIHARVQLFMFASDMYVCNYVCICLCVHMHVCRCVHIYVFKCAWMCEGLCVAKRLCMYTCMCILCVHVHAYVNTHA